MADDSPSGPPSEGSATTFSLSGLENDRSRMSRILIPPRLLPIHSMPSFDSVMAYMFLHDTASCSFLPQGNVVNSCVTGLNRASPWSVPTHILSTLE